MLNRQKRSAANLSISRPAPAGGRGRSPFAPTPPYCCPRPRRLGGQLSVSRRYPRTGPEDVAAESARSAPRSHKTANGEIEADEHHERDNPLVALGRAVRDDEHTAVVDLRLTSPQEGPNF